VRTRTSTAFWSISWSRSVGKPGGEQQRRSARQVADSRFESCRFHRLLEDSRNVPIPSRGRGFGVQRSDGAGSAAA
jgi:hypothetical protein